MSGTGWKITPAGGGEWDWLAWVRIGTMEEEEPSPGKLRRRTGGEVYATAKGTEPSRVKAFEAGRRALEELKAATP